MQQSQSKIATLQAPDLETIRGMTQGPTKTTGDRQPKEGESNRTKVVEAK